MKNQFTIGAFGIILNENDEVLLCHRRDYDLWNLPGGTMIAGESPWECVIREIKEETGFDVKIIRLAGIYNKPEKNEICFSFICKIIRGKLSLNDEADQIKYFNLQGIPNNIPQKQLERIHDAINEKEIIFKNQIGKSTIDLIKENSNN